MDGAPSCLVVDVGSAHTRVGFAGDASPLQQYNSAIGVRLPRASDGELAGGKRELLFPLNFLARRQGVEAVPALFPDWSNEPSDGSVLSVQPNYVLQPDAFEALVALSCAGAQASVSTRSFNTSSASAVASSTLGIDDVSAAKSPHCDLRFRGEPVHLSELCGLGVDLREQPLLLTEPNVSCVKLREKVAEILFESLQLCSLYTAKRALLSCIAAGRGSALVIDAGASGVSLAPVADSCVLAKRVVETSVAGDAMSLFLGEILRLHGLPVYPSFARFASVGRCSKRALDSSQDWNGVHASYLHGSRMQALAYLKEGFCRVAEDSQDIATARKPLPMAGIGMSGDTTRRKGGGPSSSFENGEKQRLLVQCPPATAAASLIAGGNEVGILELPDGTRLEADLVATKVPEVLFYPQLLNGIPGTRADHPGLADAVRRLSEAVEAEGSRDLLNALILTGGCSVIPGIVERVNRELVEDPTVCGGQKVRLLAAPGAAERRYSAWVGGSILGSLNSFQSVWCSREEYDEHGPRVLARKC